MRILAGAAVAGLLSLMTMGSAAAQSTTPYPPPSCPIVSVSTTTPPEGGTLTVSGQNFAPGEALTIELDSPQTFVLGHVTTTAAGTFSIDVTLPAGVTGNHLIRTLGDQSDCPPDPIQITIGTSSSSSAGGGGLATTGVDILTGIAIAAALLAVGALLVRGGRSRGHHSAR